MAAEANQPSSQPRPRTPALLSFIAALMLVALPLLPARPQRLSIPIGAIKPNGGYAYTISARDLGLSTALPAAGVELTEDAAPLTVDHMHNVIRSAGAGRYSPWGRTLYFSATDNTDPRDNGRAYILTLRTSLLNQWCGGAAWCPTLSLVLFISAAFLLCFACPSLAPAAASRMSAGVMRSAPVDLRCILRLALLYCAWREASADYSAIPNLLEGVNLHALAPPALDHFTDASSRVMLTSLARLAGVQIAAVVLLIGASLHLRRWMLLLALAPTLIIEWTAYHYRGQLPDIDPMLALLTIAACWPASWRAVTAEHRHTTTASTALGLTFAAYIAAVYFVCGWSKIITDGPWWKVVHLDLLYAAMIVWMGASPPQWLDGVARGLRSIFTRWPALGEASALLTMILELAWPLAVVSRIVRWIVPAMMLAAHAIIFLSSGILFLPLALTGISVVIPWRRLVRRNAGESTQPAAAPLRAWLVWPMGAAALLALIPAMNSVDVFPFSNYQHFNWNHSSLLEPTTVYRLGYRDRDSGRIEPLPPNHGGFMDCWSVALSARDVDQYLNAASDAQHDLAHARLLQYARSLRAHNSSRRLDWLSCPPHVLAASHAVPVEWFDELHLLRGRFDDAAHNLETIWEDCGILTGWPQAAPIIAAP